MVVDAGSTPAASILYKVLKFNAYYPQSCIGKEWFLFPFVKVLLF